jgi:hypothetical protein
MDELGYKTLMAEIRADVQVAVLATGIATTRLEVGNIEGLEGCAFHLCRAFNVIEMLSQRVARAFENHIDNPSGWHAELIARLSLEIPGVRPALYPPELRQELKGMRSFRHVFSHAYDLQLDRDALTLVLKGSRKVAEALPLLVDVFAAKVAAQEGWEQA